MSRSILAQCAACDHAPSPCAWVGAYMKRAFGLAMLIVGATSCCPKFDPSTYETACAVKADCVLVPSLEEDVCSGCLAVAIAASVRAQADLDASQDCCFSGERECLQTLKAECVDGVCTAVSLGDE